MTSLDFRMGDGNLIPAVGFGTFEIPDDEVQALAADALKLGYRHIDTAEGYHNEIGIGKAIAASDLARDSFFVTTKVWPGNAAWGQAVKSLEETVATCKKSAKNLCLDQIDLVILHGPFAGKEGRIAQYRGLVEAQRQGIVKTIGVSNFGVGHLKELEESGFTPAVNQIELHPMGMKKELIDYMKAKGILAIAYSSLVPLTTWRAGYKRFGGSRSDEEKQFSSVTRVASRAGVSEARVLLRWAIQKGFCVLPKSTRQERMAENADLSSFELSDTDMAELDAMDTNLAAAFGSPGQAFDPTTVF
eukprot:TRINITY_DN112749_c0_g1_i1.p1 TRINITY_DN112749_c0_g1~~TRINITY_DN112749_c0_g1_i1.p1  ORF type:complete len:303 (-),score=42.96 TRINITY_DN112749_c0_g1_i1:8-916(-)